MFNYGTQNQADLELVEVFALISFGKIRVIPR